MSAAKVAPLIDLHERVTNIEQVIMEVHGFLVTSSHYTRRDKREIMAQMPIFEAIGEMTLAVGTDGKAKQDVRNAAIAAKKQLVLYYMVGKHGWQAALHTMNATLDKNLGKPSSSKPSEGKEDNSNTLRLATRSIPTRTPPQHAAVGCTSTPKERRN